MGSGVAGLGDCGGMCGVGMGWGWKRLDEGVSLRSYCGGFVVGGGMMGGVGDVRESGYVRCGVGVGVVGMTGDKMGGASGMWCGVDGGVMCNDVAWRGCGVGGCGVWVYNDGSVGLWGCGRWGCMSGWEGLCGVKGWRGGACWGGGAGFGLSWVVGWEGAVGVGGVWVSVEVGGDGEGGCNGMSGMAKYGEEGVG
ncbi:hypothetical protein Tco_1015711 [Tanacetum coccineum]|uniref:Uncharacterized protein n=1 Tax=Tanacetum coccineum TaxID=301880 RepID=A0ABQ5FLN9_9ASTR